VVAIAGGSATAAARQSGHLASIIITAALMLALFLYTLRGSRVRSGTHVDKYGPSYLVGFAVPLVLADLVRHVLLDHYSWSELSMYRDDCNDEYLNCLSTTGILVTIVCTYTGFLLLFVGSLWNANILDKCRDIRSKWQEIRRDSDPAEADVDAEAAEHLASKTATATADEDAGSAAAYA